MLRSLALLAVLLWADALAQPGVYLVEPGDTLTRIARTFGVAPADLAALNKLGDPDQLAIGQRLIIPALQAWDGALPAPFEAVTLSPETATQGRVQTLTVRLEPGGALTGIGYLGRSIPHAAAGDAREALLPTPVLQETGSYSIVLTAASGGEAVTVALPVAVVDGGYGREQLTLSAETSRLLAPEIVGREHALVEAICAAFEPVRLWKGAFRHPVGDPVFTSEFGTLRSYNGGPYSGFHRGLDFRGEVGTPVYAAADGFVSLSDTLELYGDTVILNHGMGVCSAYMHLSERLVAAGQPVKAGDLLGRLGATGLVTGPHLHWEVRVGGVPVAPLQWTGADR